LKGIKLLISSKDNKGDDIMRNEEKIQYYRNKTIEELRELAYDYTLPESDAIISAIELQHKEEELGIAEYYTTEEVLENIFGKNKMVENC